MLPDRLDGRLHVARVVERVEDAEDVDAGPRGETDELADHVVGVVAVAEHVLPAQEHLKAGVGQGRLERAHALPRVLVQEPHQESKVAPPQTSSDQ